VPAIAHTIGIDQPAALWTLVAKHLTEEYERFGVRPTERPRAGREPASLRAPAPTVGHALRAYNGGATLPDWLLTPATAHWSP